MPTNKTIKKIRTPKPKVKTKTPNKNNISFGDAVKINKDRQVTKQFDKKNGDDKKKKKASPDLSGAASATSYRGGGSVSADNNQNYNDSRKNEKKDYTDYFNSASTESGKVND